jgi:hypothetical protein
MHTLSLKQQAGWGYNLPATMSNRGVDLIKIPNAVLTAIMHVCNMCKCKELLSPHLPSSLSTRLEV